ncbi:uncharacterized protein KIAA0232 homolog isoform X2 [Clupea harengus]|uniref:Uncharacterized protein KIAA0232 homolog isoform X2 n=1 Tax=Clupea harengus TaxID=7950 RepID=A0A6P3VGG0_CLUHA|nr:uncharacterized protein KIAA0232 homolog isoform X2 [Clupea harengus]
MRPLSGECEHSPPPPRSVSSPTPLPPPALLRPPCSEMSLLQSLGPVQNWLGQELEKCGIDAVIYTRYVLSLLLHDSYDYDLQDQENDIFLGWEKGAGKKWARSRRKGGADVSLEEMKKQAAVQCLRSASDENSGIEGLVEELWSRLKELQNKQKERGRQTNKKSEGGRSPDLAVSPSLKDQLEMYNEAFPPLSEKSVCLQEIMTVWNKDKSSTSSSQATPNTSTDTSAPKDFCSDGEASRGETSKTCGISSTAIITSVIGERIPQRRNKKEKENRQQHGVSSSGMVEERASHKKQTRSRSEGKYRRRSCSSGSSEAGSSSSSYQGDMKRHTSKTIQMRHKSRERGTTRGKKIRSQGQVKLSFKAIDKEDRKNAMGGPQKQQLPICPKKGKRSLKEIKKEPCCGMELKESLYDIRNKKEYVEEPLWYTEPLTEYFVPVSCRKSKLETTYRNNPDSPGGSPVSGDKDRLAERMQGICYASAHFQRAYLAAGTFVDGHFVELPDESSEEAVVEFSRTSSSPAHEEDSRDLDDDEHLAEFTDFYEVEIYPSILDPCASDSVQESRILNMIRQKKSIEQREFEAECLVLDGLQLHGKSAINTETLGETSGTDGFLWKDFESIAQVCECYSSSSSEVDVDRGESFVGDSDPVQLSPVFDSTMFNLCELSEECIAPEASCDGGPHLNTNSCFSLFELQCGDSPTCCFPCDSITGCHDTTTTHKTTSSSLDGNYGNNKQSRLLIWTQNSAFDGTENCSNLSTRTCSPWSHSEETRSDNEQINVPSEELLAPNASEEEITSIIIPYIPATYLEEDPLDFLKDAEVPQQNATHTVSKTISKLESVCGIALETDESGQYDTGIFDDANQQDKDYTTSGIIKDIWTTVGDYSTHMEEEKPHFEELLLEDIRNYHYCGCREMKLTGAAHVQTTHKKAVQCSVYHLWEEEESEGQELLAKNNKLSKTDSGDYTTPFLKPWDASADKDNSSFILGGVYGELGSFGGDQDWAAIHPSSGNAQGLLQCAAAAAAASSDVVTTITGTDVFMNTTGNNRFAPGLHKPLWRPLVSSFGQNDHQAAVKKRDRLTKGFSFIFHEDLIGTCSGLYGDETDQDYSFSSFDLSDPLSQVLHVECCFEPTEMTTSLSPGFKPKSILCSDSEKSDIFSSSRLYGINQTQYRAIRISPRTHFRPISTSELSPPGGGSESDIEESEKDEHNSLPTLVQAANVFDDPQADLKPLEEDAECEGPYYGKSELESGKFLPRLKKSGMEKSAQTSLDSQEGSGSGGALLSVPEQNYFAECQVVPAAATTESTSEEAPAQQQSSSDQVVHEEETCRRGGGGEAFGDSAGGLVLPHQCETTLDLEKLHESAILNDKDDERNDSQQDDCLWQSSLVSPVFSGSQCTGSSTM